MLCYQYSRNATDIIHDTFDWVRINRRAMLTIALPLLMACVVAAFFVTIDDSGLEEMHARNIFELFFKLLIPYTLFHGEHQMPAFVAYTVLTALSTMLTVPLLRRYFYYRLSLKHISVRSLIKEITHNAKPTVLSMVTMTAMCAGLLKVNILIMLILLWPLVSLLPCIIMSQAPSIVTTRLWFMIKNILLAVMFFCIIQALPALCLLAVLISVFFLSEILPGAITTSTLSEQVVTMFITMSMCLSYCAAVAVFLVNLVIIHGSLYYNPSFKQP